MFEKVNPSHPDKLADRIAGALVDMAYAAQDTPKIAVEVLIGHGRCHIIAETSVGLDEYDVQSAVHRITGSPSIAVDLVQVPQDPHLADNQLGKIRCGDNGIFRGMPVTAEQKRLSAIARHIYEKFPSDGKYVLAQELPRHRSRLIICQSNLSDKDAYALAGEYYNSFSQLEINPLGPWTGGTDVDTGATNRKLGSDMGDGVTGGGLQGKDASKADVSVNIYAHLMAQEKRQPVEFFCAIGDEEVNGIPYQEIVDKALSYIRGLGGFEKFAEWGLI